MLAGAPELADGAREAERRPHGGAAARRPPAAAKAGKGAAPSKGEGAARAPASRCAASDYACQDEEISERRAAEDARLARARREQLEAALNDAIKRLDRAAERTTAARQQLSDAQDAKRERSAALSDSEASIESNREALRQKGIDLAHLNDTALAELAGQRPRRKAGACEPGDYQCEDRQIVELRKLEDTLIAARREQQSRADLAKKAKLVQAAEEVVRTASNHLEGAISDQLITQEKLKEARDQFTVFKPKFMVGADGEGAEVDETLHRVDVELEKVAATSAAADDGPAPEANVEEEDATSATPGDEEDAGTGEDERAEAEHAEADPSAAEESTPEVEEANASDTLEVELATEEEHSVAEVAPAVDSADADALADTDDNPAEEADQEHAGSEEEMTEHAEEQDDMPFGLTGAEPADALSAPGGKAAVAAFIVGLVVLVGCLTIRCGRPARASSSTVHLGAKSV